MSTQKTNGFLSILAVVIIFIFGVIGVFATYLVNTDTLASANGLGSQQALYLADSGLNAATHQILNPVFTNRITCAGVTGNTNLTAYTITNAKGPFTVTGTGPQMPTASALNGALTATATSLVLNNASTYATSGRIMIDNEWIDYMGVSGNTLLNAQRGADNSVATTHANGAPVGQYQCTLTSVGGVPSLNPAGNTVGGMRTLREVVALPEAWAVGVKSGTTGQLMHWNNPTESVWNNATIAALNRNLNAVFMLSNADAWTVGDNGTIRHWMGNSWAASPSNTTNALLSIHCTASNNCWAVGATRTFDFWNGSVWTVQATAPFPNVGFNGVYCNTATDCWAVGNPSGGDVMMHWNGIVWLRDPSLPTPAANLNFVTCTASNNCWAVGAFRTMLRWNGTSWADFPITTMPNVNYNGVACTSSGNCWAVGNNSGGSVAIHWNGTTWSRDATATAAASVNLNAVSCNNTNDCWAVGNNGTALHWNGSSWTKITSPLTVTLTGVSSIGAVQYPTASWQEIFP